MADDSDLNSTARHWCFTLNNPEEDIHDRMLNMRDVEYAVWQLEIGEQGTEHFQGYVVFFEKKRGTTVKALFPRETHLEVARGTPTQNRRYCTKAETRVGDFCEIGIFPKKGQGKRTDLDELHLELKNGLRQHEYVERFFPLWVKYPDLVVRYKAATIKPRDPEVPVKVLLIIGAPRLGKSRYAFYLGSLIRGGCFRLWNGKWFDGYGGERGIIADDFKGSSLSFTGFKHLCDRYPVRVELKGLTCEMAATTIIITTNYDPRTWWKDEVSGTDQKAITGRITEVMWFPEENKFVHFHNFDDYDRAVNTPVRDGQDAPWKALLQEIVWENLQAEVQENVQEEELF